jgi:cytochrome P450
MSACDEDGSAMSANEVRDQVLTFLLAGHETTALALSWTWYLLATIAARFKLSIVEAHPVVPVPSFTLRPKHGIRMSLKRREDGARLRSA